MIQKSVLLSLAVLGAVALAPAQTATPSKVGTINIQAAIVGTKDGQKAAKELETKFAPRRQDLDKKQAEIQSLRDRMQKLSNTASTEQRDTLAREIDQKTKAFNREMEDAQAESETEQGRILNELGGRMMQVIEKYAKDNGFTMVLDVSSQQTPVIWASTANDITQEVISLYDKNSPGLPTQSSTGPATGGAAARPTATAPAGGATAAPRRPTAPATAPK